MGRRLVDALDAAGRVAVEDRGVLGVRRCGSRRRSADRGRGPRCRARPRRSRRATARTRCAARMSGRTTRRAASTPATGPAFSDRQQAPGVDGAEVGAVRAVEVDQLAAGQLQLEDARRLLVDLASRPRWRSARARDRRLFTGCSLPSGCRCRASRARRPLLAPPSSAPPFSACSCGDDRAAREQTRLCSSPDNFASRRRYHSSSITKCSFSSSRLCARICLSSRSVAASTR